MNLLCKVEHGRKMTQKLVKIFLLPNWPLSGQILKSGEKKQFRPNLTIFGNLGSIWVHLGQNESNFVQKIFGPQIRKSGNSEVKKVFDQLLVIFGRFRSESVKLGRKRNLNQNPAENFWPFQSTFSLNPEPFLAYF